MTAMQTLYDLSFVASIANNNNGFIRDLLQVFIDTAPQDAHSLRQALHNGDYLAIGRTAHKLKSTVDTLQIQQLTDSVRMLEAMGKQAQAPWQEVEHLTTDVINCLLEAVDQARHDPVHMAAA